MRGHATEWRLVTRVLGQSQQAGGIALHSGDEARPLTTAGTDDGKDSALCRARHNEERFWLGGAAHECRCWPSVMEAAPVSQKRVGLNRCPELAMGIVAARSLAADRRDARSVARGLAQPQGSRRPGPGWWALGSVHEAVLAGLR